MVEEDFQVVAFLDFSDVWALIEVHFFQSLLGYDLKGVLQAESCNLA